MALVAFEFLSYLLEERKGADLLPIVRHDAELWALDRLLGFLQRALAQPFDPDYSALLQAARHRVAEKCGGQWPERDA
jgi:hypothetical protein